MGIPQIIGGAIGIILGILLAIGLFYVVYFLPIRWAYRKIKRKRNNPNKIDEEKIEEKGGGLILGAKGHGDELMKNIARRIETNAIPNAVADKRMVSVDGAPEQPFLVIWNKRLRGYEMFVGAWDYGERLSVMWYVVLNVPGMMLGVDYVKVNGKFRARQGLLLTPWTVSRKMKSKKEGWVSPEKMNMLDREELEDFLKLVKLIVEDEVKKMMGGLNLDFSKVDMKSRGFVNIS